MRPVNRRRAEADEIIEAYASCYRFFSSAIFTHQAHAIRKLLQRKLNWLKRRRRRERINGGDQPGADKQQQDRAMLQAYNDRRGPQKGIEYARAKEFARIRSRINSCDSDSFSETDFRPAADK